MKKKEIRIVSLFSGCGGLDLGFEQVGNYKTLWANDFKHEACETFRNHFGDVIIEGDIEKIDPYTNPSVPDCDLILGGFPAKAGGNYEHQKGKQNIHRIKLSLPLALPDLDKKK